MVFSEDGWLNNSKAFKKAHYIFEIKECSDNIENLEKLEQDS